MIVVSLQIYLGERVQLVCVVECDRIGTVLLQLVWWNRLMRVGTLGISSTLCVCTEVFRQWRLIWLLHNCCSIRWLALSILVEEGIFR